ncbi:MAG: Uma2 family endonuclease [Bryobacteraceae bacterium]
MATVPNVKTVTYEEWLRMPEVSDAKEEVVKGQIRIMPAPMWIHFRIVNQLRRIIEPQVDSRQVLVGTEQFNLVIHRHPLTARVPDLVVFEIGTIVETDGRIHSAPQLVVEVLSPSNTPAEREEKLADYAALGVPEAWVLAPEARTVEVLYLEEGRLRRVQLLAQGILTPKHFPAVKVDIAAIWPE